jgi:hypothetical protein
LSQDGQEARFHVDQIVQRVEGGATVESNLALACISCLLHKEARRSAMDPETGRCLPLFHLRRQRWSDHFRWDGAMLVALTATGRATIASLRLSRPMMLAIRMEERERGRHPPKD